MASPVLEHSQALTDAIQTIARIVASTISFGSRRSGEWIDLNSQTKLKFGAVTDCQFFEKESGKLLVHGVHTKSDPPRFKL